MISEDGELVLSIPRDRHGRFNPALIGKYQRRFPGFDEKIIALYARGMSTRDIQAHVGEIYGATIVTSHHNQASGMWRDGHLAKG